LIFQKDKEERTGETKTKKNKKIFYKQTNKQTYKQANVMLNGFH